MSMNHPPGPVEFSQPTTTAAPSTGRRRLSSRAGAALAVMLMAGCLSWNPKPKPPPPPPPPPWECPIPAPWCHDTGQTCSGPDSPCVHNPTADPEHCELAPDCLEPPPPITCANMDCIEGYHCVETPEGPRCIPDSQPPAPPAGDVCPWNTPTARSLIAQGTRVEIRPKKEGRRAFGVTPLARFGNAYYCQPGLWSEACAAGRTFGPVAPDGHPDRIACEQRFLEQPCATISVESNEHMSLDPWIVRGGVNQNHPRNVEACGQGQFETHESWVREPYNGHQYIVSGQMSWATAHGNGRVCAAAKGGAGKRCVRFDEP